MLRIFLSLQVLIVLSIATIFYFGKIDISTLRMEALTLAEKTPRFSSDDFTSEEPTSSTAPPPPPPSSADPAVSSCACRLSFLKPADIYEEQLEAFVSWANLTTRQALEKQHPNFPVNLVRSLDEKWCHLLPMPHLIHWDNVYLQSVTVSGTTFLLYSAFFDNRELTDPRPCIRIVTYARTKFPAAPWCHIWFNSTGPPVVSRVARTEFLDWQPRTEGRQMTFLLTCPIPRAEGHAVPLAVSVVARPCEKASTLLQVTGAMERNATTAFEGGEPARGKEGVGRWSVAVCGPALYYYHEDFSVRMVEWLEILRAQGFARVFLSVTDIHPNLERVLR
ncbi:hypothetical protein C7M84_006394 [Penaeus vannamei]|nr:uncharacterized protein LOC113807458 [Penaeus vannamei]ROT75108.1 hypothetical protein C7M84_006394 [Penaeus vannamei]